MPQMVICQRFTKPILSNSGEDRILFRLLLIYAQIAEFFAKNSGFCSFPINWLLLQITGYCRKVSNVFSTLLAQSLGVLMSEADSLIGNGFRPPEVISATTGSLMGDAEGQYLKVVKKSFRTAFYARYSTKEQDKSSIVDQLEYCSDFTEEFGFAIETLEKYSDMEKSGELRNRPGIDKLWEIIKQPNRLDLIIVEDASRLFRNKTFALEFFDMAFDNNIRIICINDHIDTSKEGWVKDLERAMEKHAQDNTITRFRIRRLTCYEKSGPGVMKV